MKKILLTTLIAGFSLTNFAQAQVTTNLQSNAKLESKCLIEAQNINFGTINTLTYDGYGIGSVSLLCSKNVSYSIKPIGGYNNGSQLSNFHILRGTGDNKDAVSVRLYKASQAWHGGANGPQTGIGSGAQQSHVIRAYYSPDNNVSQFDNTITNTKNFLAKPDNYTGTVTAEVTY